VFEVVFKIELVRTDETIRRLSISKIYRNWQLNLRNNQSSVKHLAVLEYFGKQRGIYQNEKPLNTYNSFV